MNLISSIIFWSPIQLDFIDKKRRVRESPSRSALDLLYDETVVTVSLQSGVRSLGGNS